MQFLGILMGLVMVVSFFLKWEAVREGLGAISINSFLGIENYAYFWILGHRLDFLPIVLALVLILAMVLAKYKPWKYVALLAGLLSLAVAARNIRHLLPKDNLKPGLGLWLFAAASALAVIAAIFILLKKKATKPSPAATPVP
jgi:hypothetical protein